MAKGTLIANLILAGAGACSVAALAYVLYSWLREGEATSPGLMLLYVALPAALAGSCFGLLWLPPAHRINAALLFVSTGFCIYAGEAVLDIWFSLPSVREDISDSARARVAERFGVSFDTRSRMEFADALREKGIEAYPTGTRQDLLEEQPDGTLRSKIVIGTEVLPLGWISNTASVLCNETGEFVVYDSDEHGFHNPRGLWRRRPRVDIVALGDSFTNGVCVPSDKNFVALIRAQHPATLNLGMAGHGPASILATLKEYGALVRPRLVLWFHYEGNDLKDLAKERQSPLLMRYLNDGYTQGLANRQPDIDHALIQYVDEVRNTSKLSRRFGELVEALSPEELAERAPQVIKLSRVRRELGLVYRTAESETPKNGNRRRFEVELELLKKTLLEAKELVSAWGGRLHFVYLPHYRRFAKPPAPEGDRSRERVLQTVRGLGLQIIDINEVFQAQDDPLALFPFRYNGHYNETGHRLVAEAVLQAVSTR